MYHTTPARRPSWRGILAGLLMGLVVSMAMFLLALILSSFLSLDLRGAGVAAGVYAAVTALLSAFTAGYFAVKASAPEALFGDGTDILPKDATLTGMITAAAIVVITTFTAVNGATTAVRTAGSVVSGTVGALGSAAGSVAGAVGTVATGTVGAAGTAIAAGANTEQGQVAGNKLQELYQRATGNITRADIEQFIAKNNAALNEQQVKAVTNVFEDLLKETKSEVASLDFTNLETWQNLDVHAKERLASIEKTLTGDELLMRLQQEGLSEAQAQQVRDEAVTTYQEYKAKSEQAIAEARQTLEEAKMKAEQALKDAEQAARKAALYTGLFGLISMLLTFLASIAGAKKAAASYRLTSPLIVRRDI